MEKAVFPAQIPNWIQGQERPALAGEMFDKLNPATGRLLCRVARSRAGDVLQAVRSARESQPAWAETPPVIRGEILHEMAERLRKRREEVAQIVALETGKSFK